MENGQQNAQGTEPQAGLPTLGAILGNDPIVSEPAGQTTENGQQGQGNEGQQRQPEGALVPPVSPEGTNAPIEEMSIESLLSADDSVLTPENRTLKQEVFSTFGAINIDANGNLLNAQGQVVLSKGNFDKYLETGEVLIDSKGNQIDEQGNILKEASQVSTGSTLTDVSRVAIEEELGFKLLDAEGNPKSYPNSVEGNTELLRDVANNAQVNAIAAFLDHNPTLKDIYFHLAGGGNIKQYVENDIDYSTIDVTNLDRGAKLSYIKQSFDKQGLKNSDSLIKTLELSSDEALTQATADAVLALKQITDETRIQREQDYRAQQEMESKQLEEYWGNVNSVISTGKLKDIKIPDAEKEAFFKYIAVPVNSKGESQEMIDANEEDTEYKLQLSYLRYKKFDLSKLVKIKSGQSKLASLRERLGHANPKIENAQARTNGQSTAVDGAGFPTLKDLTNR